MTLKKIWVNPRIHKETVEWNNEKISTYKSVNRITKESANWNKTSIKKLRKSNRNPRGKPHQQIREHGTENLRCWRQGRRKEYSVKENVKLIKETNNNNEQCRHKTSK